MPEESESLSNNVVAAIKKEATGQIAKGVIAAVAALLVFAAAGWWLLFEPWLSQRLGGVPKNAVMAFALETTSCPPGWTDFKEGVGRTIIGKGEPLKPEEKFGADAKGRTLKRVEWPHGGEFLVASLTGDSPSPPNFDRLNIVPWIALRVCRKL